MPYDEAQIKVFPHKELKELASNMSVSKSGNKEDLVMRLEKSHAPMLKMLFDKCKKEKEEKKKEKKEKPQIITAQGEKFSEKFISDYNLQYVKSVTDADGNVNHHYVFKKKAVASAGKADPKTDDPKTTASTAAASTTIASPKTKTAKSKTSPAAPEKKKRKREEEEEEEEVVSEDDPDPHYSKGIFKARMRMCLGGDRAFLNSLIKKYDNVSIKLIQKLTDEEAIDHCVEHMTGEEIDSDDEDDEDEDEGEDEGDDE